MDVMYQMKMLHMTGIFGYRKNYYIYCGEAGSIDPTVSDEEWESKYFDDERELKKGQLKIVKAIDKLRTAYLNSI